MKGLKQMVAEATGQAGQAEAAPEPVDVSGMAAQALSEKMREWSGWANAITTPGDPTQYGSPYAACNHDERRFVFNPDRLVLNPNRVLLTVTPFRLRQEAVLTGALLHEAGHARHSHWQPLRYGNPAVLRHTDGTDAGNQTVALARLMEEPRIEGLMYRDADRIGAATLGWTLRASAAHLAPMTKMAADPDQQVMDLITSWALRAGRQYALQHWANRDGKGFRLRDWVSDFTDLLHMSLVAHLEGRVERGADVEDPTSEARLIVKALLKMAHCEDDTGPTMIDLARAVLDMLFPETDEDEDEDEGKPEPMPGGCSMQQSEQSEDETSDEEAEAEQSEGGAQSKSDEEEQGDKAEQPESSDSEDGEQDGKPEQGESDGESGEGEEDSDSGEGDSEQDSEQDGEPEQSDEEGESGASGSTEPEPEPSELAKALAELEAAASDASDEDAEKDHEAAEEEAQSSGSGAGAGSGGDGGGGWRHPNKEEREIQKGAERFIRTLIEPSESSTTTLTDTPSANVDGAALSAWKAGGQHRAPHFFTRTRRDVQPSPPVKVAVLVDISASMDELAAPSAILSWALSAAALDLRNFAGRGQQVESCLIHWGTSAKVIQRNGEPLPGIRMHSCHEGTSNMHGAMALVEEEMPGFFDIGDRAENRLLVQFTDWELYGRQQVQPWIERALASGVNMLTVAPRDYRPKSSDLDGILRGCRTQRGSASLLKYNPMFPSQVWETAAEVLAR